MLSLQIIVVFLVVAIVLYIVVYKKSSSNRDADVKREPMLQLVRQNFEKLSPQFGKIPLYEGGSSYTEDKSAIVLCLKDPHTGSHYDANTVMYVALHELAHVVSKSYSVETHNDEFKQNFGKLLAVAEKLGFYDPKKPIPPNYCGIDH